MPSSEPRSRLSALLGPESEREAPAPHPGMEPPGKEDERGRREEQSTEPLCRRVQTHRAWLSADSAARGLAPSGACWHEQPTPAPGSRRGTGTPLSRGFAALLGLLGGGGEGSLLHATRSSMLKLGGAAGMEQGKGL